MRQPSIIASLILAAVLALAAGARGGNPWTVTIPFTVHHAGARPMRVAIRVPRQASARTAAAAAPAAQTVRHLKPRGSSGILHPDDRVSLDFPQPVSVLEIYDCLAQAFGVTVEIGGAVPDRALAVHLDEVTADEAFARLAERAGHAAVRVDGTTVRITVAPRPGG